MNATSANSATTSALHQDALAAPPLRIVIPHLHLAHLAAAVGDPAAGGIALHLAVVLANLADGIVKGLLDVYRRLGRGLEKFATKGFSERFALCSDSSAFGGVRI